MQTLLLLRHAKSAWDDETLDDHDRALSPRGRDAAPRIGRLLRERALVPDLCLTSTARRARDTARLCLDEVGRAVPVREVPELYDFGDGAALIEAIQGHGGEARTLLVVGHNPAIQLCALALAETAGRDDLARLRRKYPTAGLCVLTFPDAGWTGLEPASGHLAAFHRPKDLEPRTA